MVCQGEVARSALTPAEGAGVLPTITPPDVCPHCMLGSLRNLLAPRHALMHIKTMQNSIFMCLAVGGAPVQQGQEMVTAASYCPAHPFSFP